MLTLILIMLAILGIGLIALIVVGAFYLLPYIAIAILIVLVIKLFIKIFKG